eukprot:1495243-Pyramimonas_sp.AAC.1
MLKGSTGLQLSDLQVKRHPDGSPVEDPFDWKYLALSPDSGPDMLAADHFISYYCDVNCQVEYDISHYLNNASKAALRHHTLQGVRRAF